MIMYSPRGRQTKGLSSSGRDDPRNVAILQQLTGSTLVPLVFRPSFMFVIEDMPRKPGGESYPSGLPAVSGSALRSTSCFAYAQLFHSRKARFREPTGANRAAGLLALVPFAGGAALLADGSTGGSLALALCSYSFSPGRAVVAGPQFFPRLLRTCFFRIRDLAGARATGVPCNPTLLVGYGRFGPRFMCAHHWADGRGAFSGAILARTIAGEFD